MKPIATTALLLAGALIAGPATAQFGEGPDEGELGAAMPEDATAALLTGMHELHQVVIELAQLAYAKSSSREVRAYADRLIRDHRAFDQRLSKVAKAHGLALDDMLAAAPDAEERQVAMTELMTALGSLDGRQFDMIFVHMMEVAHLSALEVLTREAHTAPAADVQHHIAGVMPLLGQHLRLARNITPRLGELPIGVAPIGQRITAAH
jgi:putative membrane protein